jgi:hypothetical protein
MGDERGRLERSGAEVRNRASPNAESSSQSPKGPTLAKNNLKHDATSGIPANHVCALGPQLLLLRTPRTILRTRLGLSKNFINKKQLLSVLTTPLKRL